MVHSDNRVHKILYRPVLQHRVHKARHPGRNRSHKIRAAEGYVSQRRHVGPVGQPRILDYVRNPHSRRAGHLAPLAVKAVLEGLVVVGFVLQTQSLSVRPRLFRTRVEGIRRNHRTVHGADRAFEALFKIIVSYAVLFHLQDAVII